MGICHSDEEQITSEIRRQPSNNMTGSDSDGFTVESAQKCDEEAIRILKRELQETPENFILNNMLMSVMFYENFGKDAERLLHTNATKMEKELNTALLNESKNCIGPNALLEKVNRNMLFQSQKFGLEQLIPRRLFVINDEIEVFDSMDLPHYSEIDKIGYKVHMEDSDRKGFVKLRLIENMRSDTQVYNQNSTDTPKPGCSHDNEEIYDYTTITALRTPKLLDIKKSDTRRDTLPDNCFFNKRVEKKSIDLDNDDIEDLDEDMFYENVSYIRSKGFMEYFQNSVFPNSLGRSLGFNEEAIENATSIPGVIFCNLLAENDNRSISCEVIPSVSIQWPAKFAYEFEMRAERPTITDTRRGVRYKWPTDEMIREMKQVNSVLIPTGYMKKRNVTEENELEWEIAFPRAERYIETRMSHAQIKCYLFLITLHKTFIEADTAKHGLLLDHIRTHMYWECELNYRDWPEHRMGVKILKVIEHMNDCLSKAKLPDYFIKQHNLFVNIPKKYLYHAQKMFHNILQSPVMYFIKAMKNLHYTNGERFYPQMNFKELYKILTTDGAKYVNPYLAPESSITGLYRRKTVEDSEQYLKILKISKNKERILKKQAKQKDKEVISSLKRKDSIDLTWTCEKNFDILKTRSILLFFLKHFIEIAKKSTKFGCLEQSLFYLKQAWYLTKILEETDGCKLDALQHQEIIAKEEEATKQAAVMEQSDTQPPSTPQRNSIQFSYDAKQQVRNNIVVNNNSGNFIKAKRTPSSIIRSPSRTISVKEEESKAPETRAAMARTISLKEEYRVKPTETTGRKSVAFTNNFTEKIVY